VIADPRDAGGASLISQQRGDGPAVAVLRQDESPRNQFIRGSAHRARRASATILRKKSCAAGRAARLQQQSGPCWYACCFYHQQQAVSAITARVERRTDRCDASFHGVVTDGTTVQSERWRPQATRVRRRLAWRAGESPSFIPPPPPSEEGGFYSPAGHGSAGLFCTAAGAASVRGFHHPAVRLDIPALARKRLAGKPRVHPVGDEHGRRRPEIR
jgi:hypothetical protein